jgi:solute carrier family 35 (UDP-galactose transporter), member B1
MTRFFISFSAAKPIAVMILSVIIAKKIYSPQKYLFVILIVASVATFLIESKESGSKEDNQIGIILVVGSLVLDGFVGATQDRIRSISKPSTSEFMYYVNYWSFLILLFVMAVTGEGRDFIQFSKEYPSVLIHIAIAVFVGMIGQYFLNAIISNFGALPCSLVTTTRKFFNVLLSCLAFRNRLTTIQWTATSVIFVSLLLDSIFAKKSSSSKSESEVIDSSTVSVVSVKNIDKIDGILSEKTIDSIVINRVLEKV